MLGISLTYNEIKLSINGIASSNENKLIEDISIDSRTVLIPEKTAFFCIKGKHHDAHDYINLLYAKGVRCFIVNQIPKDISILKNTYFIQVENSITALQDLARYYRQKFSFTSIGLTGSNGKTIVKEWLYQLLKADFSICRSPKSYNSQVGVPLSVLLLKPENELGIFEAGISLRNEMQNLNKIIAPKIGILTNIGESHQENFNSIQEKILEKIKLFKGCDTLIYSKDFIEIDKLVKQDFKGKIFTWSRNFKADLIIKKTQINTSYSVLSLIYKNSEFNIKIPFRDSASIENCTTCIAFMLLMNYDINTIKNRIANLFSIPMRLEIKDGIYDSLIINDFYNSDLNSVNIAIDLLNQQAKSKFKTLILSDIYETGLKAQELYKKVAELVKNKKIDNLIGVGNNITNFSKYFKSNSIFFKDTEELIQNINLLPIKDQAILIKGARKFEFEKISNLLQTKNHRTVLEVNLNAMIHNLNFFRGKLYPNTKTMVMVKAFSYGSGLSEIAGLLEYHGVDYLGVAIADEGAELRKKSITIPIIVMNPDIDSFNSIVENNLEPEIYSFYILKEFENYLKSRGIVNYPIHIKIDTGMHRLGFLDYEISQLISQLKSSNTFHIKSIFSHLAGSDSSDFDDFTNYQIDLFEKLSKQFISSFNYKIIRHILNTSGIIRANKFQFDMVRLGIGLYGVCDTCNDKLENVTTLKTSISQIKIVKKEDTIGYSRKGKINQDTKIAILPIGYADGLSRSLSNKVGKVYINGNLVPIIGNICMDMCMIDISNIEAQEGDKVIVFGKENPVWRLSELTNTIPYEILTGVSQRVKRIYLHE